GLLLGYLSKNQFKYLQGFKRTIYDVRWLNWEGRDLDRLFMNQLNADDWRRAIKNIQTDLTDAVIDASVKKLPVEIYPLDSAEIPKKLKNRRDVLTKEAMIFYKFLSKNVNIVGSNQQEYFKVKNNGDSLQVIVYRKKDDIDSAGILYNRTFDSRITKELRLYGLNGNDKFEIADNASSKIKIRMIGGKGNDTFNIKGKVRNFIYDIKATDTTREKNEINKSKSSSVYLSSDPFVNEYKPSGESYNIYRFPQFNLGYNPEDKLLIGFGASAKTFGFRKDPFSTYQKLSALYAPSHSAYQVKYQGIFNQVLFNNDILVNADLVSPTLNNFFGFGNSTVKDEQKPEEYYRVRYKYFSADLLLRNRLASFLDFSFGPTYYHYSSKFDDNKNRILANPLLIGSDSARIYSNKDYLGGKARLDINFVNNELVPTRGITWYNEFSALAGLSGKTKNLIKLTSDMTVYASFNEERKWVGIARFGIGKIFSKNFEYFQALSLGANNFIRGFRKERFSGSGLAYGSAELRVKLFKSQSYILPGDVGVIGFYDVGKVWMRYQTSKKWHQSFGGGLYYSPFNIIIISGTVGISDEDKLLNFSLGTKFRLTF
ncbi:MAG TPA: hypothetical protein VMY77_18400, partial [Chitinophagaceae bacterium]|nr:hypothetical protein [Chitinophagaceae bacterium]